MTQNAGVYKVTIFGDQYSLKTDENADLIVQAACMVDAAMKEVSRCSNLETKNIAVLAALRMAHQILKFQVEQGKAEALAAFIDQEMHRLELLR